MTCLKMFAVIILIVAVVMGTLLHITGLGKLLFSSPAPKVRPHVQDVNWWGPGPTRREDNVEVKPLTITYPESSLKDLKNRLANTKYFTSLEDTQFQYGFRNEYLKEIVNYWANKYDWRAQEKKLNTELKQYQTQIDGLNIHFLHMKAKPKEGQQVRPMLIVHGWPGSFYEFIKLIPLLTEPTKVTDYVFDLVIPSIPGYGYSQPPQKKGFCYVHAAQMFRKLMHRLGYKRYYTQGGDWGSLITSGIAKQYPEDVMGVHLNLFNGNKEDMAGLLRVIVAPQFFLDDTDYPKLFPVLDKLAFLLQETGYAHIQATKPDTVGAALRDSPAGLAAYILEKFSTWTDPTYVNLVDGGLTKKYTMDELLTNVMIYWTSGCIATSFRFYKENFNFTAGSDVQIWADVPITVPAGLACLKNELFVPPKVLLTNTFKDIVQYTDIPDGGHFAAFEVPELLADDIMAFVSAVEERNDQQPKTEL